MRIDETRVFNACGPQVLNCNLGKANRAKTRLGVFVCEQGDALQVRHKLGSDDPHLRALVWGQDDEQAKPLTALQRSFKNAED